METRNVILMSGQPQKLNDIEFQDLFFSFDGFLYQFTNNDRVYCYFRGNFLNNRHPDRKFIFFNGYYDYEKVKYFMNYEPVNESTDLIPTAKDLKEKHMFGFYIIHPTMVPEVGELVNVSPVSYYKHSFIMEKLNAEFKLIKESENSKNLKNYKKNGELDFPKTKKSNNGFVSLNFDLSNDYSSNTNLLRYKFYQFYKVNFVDKYPNWVLTSEELKEFDKYFTCCVSRIAQIVEEILPFLTESWNWTEIDKVGNGLLPDDTSLSNYEKILLKLKKSWALYYSETNPYLSIFPNSPNIEYIKAYYSRLTNFYLGTFQSILSFENENETTKLQLLFRLLPNQALQLIDLPTRLSILHKIAINKIREDNELLVLNIISTFSESEADQFLNFLIDTKITKDKEEITLLESLYDKVNDSILFYGEDNRKALMEKMLYLWFVSSYNPNYDMSYGYNETQAAKYFDKPALLNYHSNKVFGFFSDNMNFKYNNELIDVFEEKITTTKIRPSYGNDFQSERTTTEYELTKSYHLFQPVTLMEYNEDNFAIKIPTIFVSENYGKSNAIIPMFYIKYIDDFGDSEDFKAGVGLVFDIALTFTGIGNLSKLRYLRYLGKFGKVFTKTAGYTEIKFFYKAIQGVAGTLEISASLASIMLDKLADGCATFKTDVKAKIKDGNESETLPDVSTKDNDYYRCYLLDKILFWMQIGSLGMDLLAGRMIRKAAKEFKQKRPGQSEILGYGNDWDPALTNGLDEMVAFDNALFDDLISTLPTNQKTIIENKLGSAAKSNFTDDFGNMSKDADFWTKLTANEGQAIDNWAKLRELGVVERTSLNVIEDAALVNKYANCMEGVSKVGQKAELLKFSADNRKKFINIYGAITPTPSSNFIKVWGKLDELVEFRNVKYLNKFDNYNDELIEMFIYELKHEKRGPGIRQLIKESPDDIENVMRKVLNDPGNAKTFLKESGDLRWKKWGDGQFFKFYTKTGKHFEKKVVNKALLDKSGDGFNKIKNCIEGLSAPPSRNINDYEVFSGLQLKIGTTSNYFVADQVFVKFAINSTTKEKYIADIIIMETKLTDATKLSANQQIAFENIANKFYSRTKTPQDIFGKVDLTKNKLLKEITKEPTFIKCTDTKEGNTITKVEKILTKTQ